MWFGVMAYERTIPWGRSLAPLEKTRGFGMTTSWSVTNAGFGMKIRPMLGLGGRGPPLHNLFCS